MDPTSRCHTKRPLDCGRLAAPAVDPCVQSQDRRDQQCPHPLRPSRASRSLSFAYLLVSGHTLLRNRTITINKQQNNVNQNI